MPDEWQLELIPYAQHKIHFGPNWPALVRNGRRLTYNDYLKLPAELNAEAVKAAGYRTALEGECRAHSFPLVLNPQENAHYPLSGWYHRVGENEYGGGVFAKCDLNEASLAALWGEDRD